MVGSHPRDKHFLHRNPNTLPPLTLEERKENRKFDEPDDIKTLSLSLPLSSLERMRACLSSSTRIRAIDRSRKFLVVEFLGKNGFAGKAWTRNWDDKRIAGNRRYRARAVIMSGFIIGEEEGKGRGRENLVCERISGLRAAVSRGIDAVHRSLIAPRSGSLKIITLE